MKKRFVSLLAIVMTVSLVFAACSKNKDDASSTTPAATAVTSASSTTAPTVEPAANAAPVEISVFAHQDTGQDLQTSAFSKKMEDMFNFKFKWEIIPYDGAKEKRQISLASGDYPDSYMLTHYIDQFSQADVLKYGKQGVIIPLNDLIDQYAPNIKAALEKDSLLKSFSTAPDGNIYGLVSYSNCFHCSYANKMWLNTKWLKALNLETPKTTEDFKKVLEAFKNNDPNGNKKKDEVVLSGSIEDFGVHVIPFLMNGFVYDDDRYYLNLTNGKVETAASKPEWKEGLTYIKSLYDEGLIDPGAFTQNAEAFKKIGENGDAQILGAGAGMHPAIFINIDPGNKRSADYDAIPPLQGPHASYATHDSGGIQPGAKFVITNKASKEAQIALIKMIDYMFIPEGQEIATAGTEGIGWRKPIAGEEALGKGVTPLYFNIPPVEGAAPNNTGWGGMGHFYEPKAFRDAFVQSTDIYQSTGYERRLYNATLLYEGKEPKELFPAWAVWMRRVCCKRTSKNTLKRMRFNSLLGIKI
jgi:putative aldouronate transport system substrate-binding protein